MVADIDWDNADRCLEGAYRKLDRAKVLTEQIQQRIAEATNPDSYSLRYVASNEGRHHEWHLTYINEIDSDISILLGDALHNYRSALDHVAWELTTLGKGATGESTFFPLRLHSRKRRERTSTVEVVADSEIVDFIDKLQPFHGAGHNEPLHTLHALNIHDKHRSVLINVRSVDTAIISLPEGTSIDHSFVWGSNLTRSGLLMGCDTTLSADLAVGSDVSLDVFIELDLGELSRGSTTSATGTTRLPLESVLYGIEMAVQVDVLHAANQIFRKRHRHGAGEDLYRF